MATEKKKKPQKARPQFSEHPVEWLLSLFGDVRPGEGPNVILLTLNVFLILTAYYLLKVAREPLILLGGGAEVKAYASVGQSFLLIFATSFYGWLATRVRRIVLIAFVTMFFVANLLLFWFLGLAGAPLGVPFFLWVGIFNMVTIAQFWSFTADIYTEEQGKRLFPIIGIGSSVGGVAGAWVADRIVAKASPFLLMLVAAGILVAALGITYLVHRREIAREKEAHDEEEVEEPVAPGNAFLMVFKDRYLLFFALLVLALNFVTRSGDYVLDRMLLLQAPEKAHALNLTPAAYIGQFKAQYFEYINVIGVVLQLFIVSRIIKYVGLRAALVLIPVASFFGYGTAFVFPLISVMFVGRIVESSLDYSLSSTTQQMLWLVTSREAKYKAKQVIDAFFRRAGDTMSAGMVWLSVHLALSTRTFLAVNAVVALVWVGLAVVMGKDYAELAAKHPDAAKLVPE